MENEDFECCGQHEVCEKESLLAAVSKEIEYYEDEELDRFRGKEADEYSNDEIEEFRYVLETMNRKAVYEAKSGSTIVTLKSVYLAKLIGDHTKKIILMHLSDTNNTEKLALKTIKDTFKEYEINFKDIKCAKQDEVSEVMML